MLGVETSCTHEGSAEHVRMEFEAGMHPVLAAT